MKRVVVYDPAYGYQICQRNYMRSFYKDFPVRRLIPNTVVLNKDGSPLININSDGFKGEEINPEYKLVFVWGDSCVFGCGDASWVESIELPKRYQVINGGIEGNHILAVNQNVRLTHEKFSRQTAAQIVYGSWHPVYDNFDRTMWKKAYEDMARTDTPTVFYTLPSPVLHMTFAEFKQRLNGRQDDHSWATGLMSLEHQKHTFKSFLGSQALTREYYTLIQDNLKKINDLIQTTGMKTGTLVFDLAHKYLPAEKEDFTEYFIDAAHPNPFKYTFLGKLAVESLTPILV